MSQESDEVRVFSAGNVWRAEVGTPFPATWDEEIDLTDWFSLGYLTEEGPRPKFGREEKDIKAWQKASPVRSLTTEVPKSIAFDLLQTNRETLITSLGGGTITESPAGNYKYVPPSDDENAEWALIIEGIDGDIVTRICYRRAKQIKEVEFSFVRDDATKYALEMKVLAADAGEDDFEIVTNDPNFDVLGVSS